MLISRLRFPVCKIVPVVAMVPGRADRGRYNTSTEEVLQGRDETTWAKYQAGESGIHFILSKLVFF